MVFLPVQQRLFLPLNERSFMNVFFWALHEQNRLPRASFYSFMNSCMALFVNVRSFPVDEHPQIRWRTISDCVSACIEFGAKHVTYMERQMDKQTDEMTE